MSMEFVVINKFHVKYEFAKKTCSYDVGHGTESKAKAGDSSQSDAFPQLPHRMISLKSRHSSA